MSQELHTTEQAEFEDEHRYRAQDLLVEFLFVDLERCTRCQGTDAVLNAALNSIAPALSAAGLNFELRKHYVGTYEEARSLGLQSSPTIRINGHDIQSEIAERNCESCGDVSGGEVTCRVWRYDGDEHATPPVEMLVRAMLSAAFGDSQDIPDADATESTISDPPENLRQFFEDKRQNLIDEEFEIETDESNCNC